MKKKIMLLALGASIMAVPAMAQPAAKADASATWTRAQAETQATERFAKMDVNKDGTFDAADRTQMRTQRDQARFTALDADKNGQISQAEWTQAQTDRTAKMQERRAQFAAKHAAASTSDAAPSAVPKARGERRGKGAGFHRGMGRMGGRDGAQAVTQAQFVAKALERFDRLDANKDGNVTAAERQAAKSERKAQRGARPAPAAAK